MALGSGTPAATASPNQRSNCAIGSGSTSATSSRSAGSTRRRSLRSDVQNYPLFRGLLSIWGFGVARRTGAGAQRAEGAESFGRRRGGGPVRLLQGGEHLFAVHLDVARRLDADPDLVTAHFEHGDHHVLPDHDALVRVSGEDEHEGTPSMDGRCTKCTAARPPS